MKFSDDSDQVRSWVASPLKLVGIAGVIGTVLAVALGGWLWETVSADEVVIIQSPVSGDLNVITEAGLAWQGLGYVVEYDKRTEYEFLARLATDGKTQTGGIPLRFNDGSHGTIFGSIQFELPTNKEKLRELRSRYKDMDAVRTDIYQAVTNNSIYLVGTLMSAKESYAEKRNDLIHYVIDQVQNGIYKTRQKREWVKDPITNETKETVVAEIVMGPDGKPERQDASVLNYYGIKAFNFLMKELPYDVAVEKQIEQQRQITMDIQTSIAEKLKQEQRARTAESQGRANATEAKWAQETIKIAAETQAEKERNVAVTKAKQEKEVAETGGAQRLAVADLDRKAAEQKKLENILLGEGEAARKKLVLEADGALEQKLKAYVDVNAKYAEMLKGTALVPQMSLGGTGSGGGAASTVDNFVTALTAMASKQLMLDMTMVAQPKR